MMVTRMRFVCIANKKKEHRIRIQLEKPSFYSRFFMSSPLIDPSAIIKSFLMLFINAGEALVVVRAIDDVGVAAVARR